MIEPDEYYAGDLCKKCIESNTNDATYITDNKYPIWYGDKNECKVIDGSNINKLHRDTSRNLYSFYNHDKGGKATEIIELIGKMPDIHIGYNVDTICKRAATKEEIVKSVEDEINRITENGRKFKEACINAKDDVFCKCLTPMYDVMNDYYTGLYKEYLFKNADVLSLIRQYNQDYNKWLKIKGDKIIHLRGLTKQTNCDSAGRPTASCSNYAPYTQISYIESCGVLDLGEREICKIPFENLEKEAIKELAKEGIHEPIEPPNLPTPPTPPSLNIQCCKNEITGDNMEDIIQQCEQSIEDNEKIVCDDNSVCGSKICQNGQCVSCTQSIQCSNGYFCDNGNCILDECGNDKKCGNDKICDNGKCVDKHISPDKHTSSNILIVIFIISIVIIGIIAILVI